MSHYLSYPFIYTYRNAMNFPAQVSPVAPAPTFHSVPMPTNDLMQQQIQTPEPVQPMQMPQMLQPMQPNQLPQMMQPTQNMQPMQPMQNMQNMQMPQTLQPQQPMCPFLQQMQQPMPNFPMYPSNNSPMMPWMEESMMDMEEDFEEMDNDRDPPPVLSNNPPTASILLYKELTGYPNYGNPSGNADILYTGNRGSWNFNLPQSIVGQGFARAQIIIRGVLDDHYNTPANRYSAEISINGNVVHRGQLPLEHGTPSGTRFTNWRDLTFSISNLRNNNRIVIRNTSTANADDWIAFDWIEMRFFSR